MNKEEIINEVKEFAKKLRAKGVQVNLDVNATTSKIQKIGSLDTHVTFRPTIIIEVIPKLDDRWDMWE